MFTRNGRHFDSDFLQASGSKSQLITVADTPVQVKMDTVDLSSGIELDTITGDVKVSECGEYFFVAAPQVGRTEECLLTTPNFRCWTRVNGVDVPNSNVLLNVTRGLKDVIVAQGILELEEDDVVSVMMASNYGNVVGAEAIQPAGEPLVPSIIFSIFKLPKGYHHRP